VYDTVRVSVNDDFRLDADARVSVQPAVIKYGGDDKSQWNKRLFKWESGDWEEGYKAFINTEQVNVTFFPRYSDYQNYEVKAVVSFNPGKVMTGGNIEQLTRADFATFYGNFESMLANVGVHADWPKAQVTRLDVGLNLATKHPEADYIKVLRKLPIRRTLKRIFHGDESILFRNKSSQFALYDKRAEAYKELKPRERARISPLLRLERRALLPRVVRRQFGVKSLADLQNEFTDICERGLAELRSLFSFDISEPALFDTEAQIIDTFKGHHESGARNWRQRALVDVGFLSMARVISRDRLYDILKEMGVKGSALTDTRKQFDEVVFSNTVRNERKALYSELREAVDNAKVA